MRPQTPINVLLLLSPRLSRMELARRELGEASVQVNVLVSGGLLQLRESGRSACECMCVCIYIYMFVYICMYIYTCVYIYVCMYVYIYIHINICIYLYIHLYIYIYLSIYLYPSELVSKCNRYSRFPLEKAIYMYICMYAYIFSSSLPFRFNQDQYAEEKLELIG